MKAGRPTEAGRPAPPPRPSEKVSVPPDAERPAPKVPPAAEKASDIDELMSWLDRLEVEKTTFPSEVPPKKKKVEGSETHEGSGGS
jgi:hypothetical protein